MGQSTWGYMSNFAPYNDRNFNFKKGVYEHFTEGGQGQEQDTEKIGPSENEETQLQQLCSTLGWTCTPPNSGNQKEVVSDSDEEPEDSDEEPVDSDSEEEATTATVENFENSYTDSKGHCVGARPGTYTRHTSISDLTACQAKCDSESDCILIGHGPWNNDGTTQCITYSK